MVRKICMNLEDLYELSGVGIKRLNTLSHVITVKCLLLPIGPCEIVEHEPRVRACISVLSCKEA